jgi:hypothetical protein
MGLGAAKAKQESDLGDGVLSQAWLASLRFLAPVLIVLAAVTGWLSE